MSSGPPSGGSVSGNAAAVPSADKIIREMMHKTVQIILRSRIPAQAELSKASKVNSWFNLQLPEWAGVRFEVDELLRSSGGGVDSGGGISGSASSSALFGSSSASASSSSGPVTGAVIQLDILLRNGRNYDQHVLLERWSLQHDRSTHYGGGSSATKKTETPAMYKKLLLQVRSIFCFVKLLPAHAAWRLAQGQLDRRVAVSAFVLGHQLSSSERSIAALQEAGLVAGLIAPVPNPSFDSANGGTSPSTFTFHAVATPAGRFTLQVQYRPHLEGIPFLQKAGVTIGPPRIIQPAAQQQHMHQPSVVRQDSGSSAAVHAPAGGAGDRAGAIVVDGDYFAPRESNLPPSAQHHTTTAHFAMGSNSTEPPAQEQQQHQLSPPPQAQPAHPPKAGLALQLEALKRKQEGLVDQATLQLEQQRYLEAQQECLAKDPRKQGLGAPMMMQQQQHYAPGSTGAGAGEYHGRPRSDSDALGGGAPPGSLGSSVGVGSAGSYLGTSAGRPSGVPMSIPHPSFGVNTGTPVALMQQQQQQQQGQQQPLQPHSMPAQHYMSSAGVGAHHPSHAAHPSSSAQHSPSSHSPSFSATPPVSTGGASAAASSAAHMVAGGSSAPGPGAMGIPMSQGMGAAGMGVGFVQHPTTDYTPAGSLQQRYHHAHSHSHALSGHHPHSSSGTNLFKLDESPEDEQQQGALPHQQQQPLQQQYGRSSLGGGVPVPPQPLRPLSHSNSQPVGFSPLRGPVSFHPSHHSHLPVSGSMTLPPSGASLQQQQQMQMQFPSTPSSNPFIQPGSSAPSRKNSLYGSSPDQAGAMAAKPPLPLSSPSYAPFSSSSRAAAPAGSKGSPQLGAQPSPISGAGGTMSPSPAAPATPSTPGSSIVVRERDGGMLGRFSGVGAAQALPPPKLGSTNTSPSPSPSGIGRALAQAGVGQAESPHSASSSPISIPAAAGGTQTWVRSGHTPSPTSSPFIGPVAGSPNASSRPMAIPSRAGTGAGGGTTVAGSLAAGGGVGSLFARTPPFAAAGSETSLSLMQRQSAIAGLGSPDAAGLLGSSHPSRRGSIDVLGSSQPAYTFSVPPFRDPTGRKQSISAGATGFGAGITSSPVLGAITPTGSSTPAQRVQITPQVAPPLLDLKASGAAPVRLHSDSASSSTGGVGGLGLGTPRLDVDSVGVAGIAGAADDEDEDDDTDAADDVHSFHSFVSNLQQQQQQQQQMHSSSSMAAASMASASDSQAGVSSAGRMTSAQALFEQLDRLAAAAAPQQQQ